MGSGTVSLLQQKAHLQSLLADTVTLLCRNSIPFQKQLCVEGLLGITVDSEAVILINLKELILQDGIGQTSTSSSSSIPNHVNVHPELYNGFTPRHSTDNIAIQKGSSSRRKRKVTRKAIINLENGCMDDDEDDEFSSSYLDDNSQSTDPLIKDAPQDFPINLVKKENSESTQTTHGDYSQFQVSDQQESPSNTILGTVLEEKLAAPKSDKLLGYNNNILEVGYEVGLKSTHASSLPQAMASDCQMRKYGAYGYIINQGNKVMYSCKLCPKVFQNRVSLWRHGVKHRQTDELQKASASVTQLPCSVCGNKYSTQEELQLHMQGQHSMQHSTNDLQVNATEKEITETTDEESGSLNTTQQRMIDYQRSLGISTSSVSSYGIMSHIGQNKWYTCVICHQKFLNRGSLWRHKAKHFKGGICGKLGRPAITSPVSHSLGGSSVSQGGSTCTITSDMADDTKEEIQEENDDKIIQVSEQCISSPFVSENNQVPSDDSQPDSNSIPSQLTCEPTADDELKEFLNDPLSHDHAQPDTNPEDSLPTPQDNNDNEGSLLETMTSQQTAQQNITSNSNSHCSSNPDTECSQNKPSVPARLSRPIPYTQIRSQLVAAPATARLTTLQVAARSPRLKADSPVGSTRAIGDYGHVTITLDGKLYACAQCEKTFKNRVSLWKHQFKHQPI